MPNASARQKTIAWVDAPRAAIVKRILSRVSNEIQTVAVGGPQCGEVDALAAHLRCPRYDDLRRMRLDHRAGFVLAASDDSWPAALLGNREEAATILALEPPLQRFDDLTKPRSGRHRRGMAQCGPATDYQPAGSFLQCEGWSSAADPRELLQGAELMRYFSAGPRADQSLFARMFEAWYLLLNLAELPHTIDSSGSGQTTGDDLWSLSGSMSAHARYAGGICATLDVSDVTGLCCRMLQVLGNNINLTVADRGYRLRDGGGQLLETHGDVQDEGMPLDEQVTQHWKQLLQQAGDRPGSSPPIEHVLACCIAMHLSSRAGEPERPASILAMGGYR